MSIDQQASAVVEMLQAEMEKSKTIIFDGLLSNPTFNCIPESLFVNYFLPCWIGRSNNPNWVMEWISIAGSPMAELGIIKDGTTEVLYYVPSILNSNNLFLHKSEGDLGDIFAKYQQYNGNVPAQGLGFLFDALSTKNQELLKKVNFTEVNQRWINILNRYGLIQQTNVSNQENNNSDNADYFEI
jgi:hypothetical protein